MITATKEFEFSAAHRIEGHPKCGRLHGHNYRLVVSVGCPHVQNTLLDTTQLDAMGFVMDFGDLKRIVTEAVLDRVDHRYMVSQQNSLTNDPYANAARESNRADEIALLPIPSTSAELMALHFKDLIGSALVKHGFGHVAVLEVQLWETSTSYATA